MHLILLGNKKITTTTMSKVLLPKSDPIKLAPRHKPLITLLDQNIRKNDAFILLPEAARACNSRNDSLFVDLKIPFLFYKNNFTRIWDSYFLKI